MYVTTNSSLVWKREADENLQTAKVLARICVGLFILTVGAGAYAFSTHSQYTDLCETIQIKAKTETSHVAREMGKSIVSSYCS